MNAAMSYKQMAIVTQNPGRIIVMLYDGAIQFLKRAKYHIENREMIQKNTLLLRVQDIIFELNASLDMEKGGEITKNLRSLYTYIWVNVSRVNIKNDITLLNQLTAILEDLAGAWRKIST